MASAEKIKTAAPRLVHVKIPSDKIRDLIGPSGKHIKKIASESGTKVDVDDSGIVSIMAPDVNAAQAAKTLIRTYTSTLRVGDIYLGKANRVTEFGVFIEIKPGVEGLCHITQLNKEQVTTVEDVINEGDAVLVKVVDIDRQGRVKLSRKEALGKKPTFAF